MVTERWPEPGRRGAVSLVFPAARPSPLDPAASVRGRVERTRAAVGAVVEAVIDGRPHPSLAVEWRPVAGYLSWQSKRLIIARSQVRVLSQLPPQRSIPRPAYRAGRLDSGLGWPGRDRRARRLGTGSAGRVHLLGDHLEEVLRQLPARTAPSRSSVHDIQRPASCVLHAVEVHARGPNGGPQGGRLYFKPDVGGAPPARLTRRPA